MNIFFREDRTSALAAVEEYRKCGEVEVVEDNPDYYDVLDGDIPVTLGWRTICIRTETDTHTILYL